MTSTGGFPGTTGAGSVFYASQGDALSTAVNSGWLEDQSINYGTGAFATRAFVNGTTSFISTGDGTAFYVPGRMLRIAQGTSTTFAAVAESSFSVGATIVRVPYNSTGGTVALSTLTAFTAVMAGPLLPGSSGNMPMTLNVLPSTATANFIAIGTAPASSGPAIFSTGADTNIDLRLVPKGTGNVVVPGLSATAVTSSSGVTAASFAPNAGSAAAGFFRAANNPTGGVLAGRNAGNSADIVVVQITATDIIQFGGTAGTRVDMSDVNSGISQQLKTYVADSLGHMNSSQRYWAATT